jgi:hypothetical protein
VERKLARIGVPCDLRGWIGRDNLIIDRYDPVFATMRATKREHLRSQNSEDALTWNVFRSLRQIDDVVWLPRLAEKAFDGATPRPAPPGLTLLWRSVKPPPALLSQAREGPSEVDVIVESATWVWFIEAKYRSDVSLRTTWSAGRNQILRNLDVGTHYAGVRDFYFSLLILDPAHSREGIRIIDEYRDLSRPRQLLADHRPDGLKNLKAISLLKWDDLLEVLRHAADTAPRDDERVYARRAIDWMSEKKIGDRQHLAAEIREARAEFASGSCRSTTADELMGEILS